MLFVIHRLLRSLISLDSPVFRWYPSLYSELHFRWRSLRGMRKAAERSALQLSSDIDYRALSWMFGTLNDDDKFEQFFDALSDLCDSEALMDPRGAFVKPNEKILSHALIGMMDRTLSSDVIPESVKLRRIIVFTKVINTTSLLRPWWTLRRVLLGEWHGFSRSIQFGLFAQGLENAQDRITALYAQYVLAFTIATVQERDNLWFQLTFRQLDVSKILLWNHFQYGDSLLLVNVIFIVRRTIQTYSGSPDHHRRDILAATSRTLRSLCKFSIQQAFPERRHEFCSLWNQLVDMAQNDGHPHLTPLLMMTLKSIRLLYVALHKHTIASPTPFFTTTATDDEEDPVLDDVMSYPVCNLFGHRPSVSVLELQLDEPNPDTTGRTPPAIPGSDLEIPTLSHVLLSALRPIPYSFLIPRSSPMDASDNPIWIPTATPSSSLDPAGPVPQILEFNGYGEFVGLLYHSPHTVLFQGELYPTALHLFEARKFLNRRPDLAGRIRECERVEDVTSISAELEEFTRQDWHSIALSTVGKPFFHVSCVSGACLFFFMANQDWWTGLDGRCIVHQVLSAQRSAHATSQHIPHRARLRRVRRPLLGRRRWFRHERARQVAHACARSAARRFCGRFYFGHISRLVITQYTAHNAYDQDCLNATYTPCHSPERSWNLNMLRVFSTSVHVCYVYCFDLFLVSPLYVIQLYWGYPFVSLSAIFSRDGIVAQTMLSESAALHAPWIWSHFIFKFQIIPRKM